MFKPFYLMVAAVLPIASFANEISVSDVSVAQSGSRLVTVSYKLGAPAIVTVDFLTNGVSIGEKNFSNLEGDVNRLVTETDSVRTIKWQPRHSWPDNTHTCLTAKVTAHLPEEPPDYMVVALDDDTAPAYYVSTNAFPDGGLSNDIYRTSRLVMRCIRAAGVRWQMGATVDDFVQAGSSKTPEGRETAHGVVLSADYFIGIYPVTQEQYRRMTGAAALGGFHTNYVDSAMRPRTGVNYNNLRGANTGVGHYDLTSGCTIMKLRNLTGIDFDLPSDAEWEYACKAGTTWLLYTGDSYTEDNVEKLGWVYSNSAYPELPDDDKKQTHAVGQKLPNAWGLYDMIGNTVEWCRDKYVENLGVEEVVDPVMDTDAVTERVVRGTRYNYSASNARTTYRYGQASNLNNSSGTIAHGFRLVCPAGLKYGAE